MQSYGLPVNSATLFNKNLASAPHFLAQTVPTSAFFHNFTLETQPQGYGKLLDNKGQTPRRTQDHQALGRSHLRRRQTLPRPASETSPRGQQASIKQKATPRLPFPCGERGMVTPISRHIASNCISLL